MDDIESEMKQFLAKSKDLMSIGFTVEQIKEMEENTLEKRINRLLKRNYDNCLLKNNDIKINED